MSHSIEAITPVAALGWTPERKVQFLDRLAMHGNARAACRAVGLSAEAAYKLRRRDPLFARAWAAAVLLGRDNSIQVLGERAIEGVEEEIYYRGELVGTRRRYDSRLLLAHLARLDRLADEQAAGVDAGRFDELIACIAAGSSDPLPPDRDEYIAQMTQGSETHFRREERVAYYGTRLEGEADADDELFARTPADQDFEIELDQTWSELEIELRAKTGADWDERQQAAFAAVDALTGATAAPLAATPVADLDTDRRAIAVPAAGWPLASDDLRPAFPCTPSTASTGCPPLRARMLSGTCAATLENPRSPFSAPRLLPARRG